MSILIFLLVSYILLSFSLMPLFAKAGVESRKALIPGVNFAAWCKIIGRQERYALWLLFPIVNLFIFAGMAVDMVRSFGKMTFWDSALAVIYAPLRFWLIGRNDKDKYLGPTLQLEKQYHEQLEAARASNNAYEVKKLEANNPYKKSPVREWVEAIVFAVFAAAFIRMFLIEAYVIPTSSMEGSLLVGDFLFVSKAHYGIRTPMTVAQVPLLHNRLPVVDRESYLESPSLPYYRLPGITSIQRNDPVVFNYPEGDSVYVFKERAFSIYDIRRMGLTARFAAQDLTVRPLDKRDHYIKRCIAVAGDTLEIRDHQVYINGQKVQDPRGMQTSYKVSAASGLNLNKLDEWGVNVNDHALASSGYFNLTNEQVEKIKTLSGVTVEMQNKAIDFKGQLFPHDTLNYGGWTPDNYGPLYIPRKGATVQLTPGNIAIYRRIIGVYEQNKLEERDGRFYINGQETASYTFKQNYYWMMGDNRHNSEDSRYWGFVPEDHVVGKPLFIWFSTKNGNMANGIRWNRLFTSANKM